MTREVRHITSERDRSLDLEFARQAAQYLEKRGLSRDEVLEYLAEEFDLDGDTARDLVRAA